MAYGYGANKPTPRSVLPAPKINKKVMEVKKPHPNKKKGGNKKKK